jgi:hypothetical protein
MRTPDEHLREPERVGSHWRAVLTRTLVPETRADTRARRATGWTLLLLAVAGWVVTFLRADPANFQIAFVGTEVAGVQILPTGRYQIIGCVAAVFFLCVDAWAGVFTYDRSDGPLLLFVMAGFAAIALGDLVKVWTEHNE